ncbi:MAG: tetratricopeptide repeat protein, partial [Chloroflexi bacterium]|nr:tetratricopeptide repeat protein [Chloroflexota bacterium]
DALNALLGGQHHAVKVVITTRIAPRDLAMGEPGRQHHLSLDEGLESPYAENVLREMDADGRVGLKSAPDTLLNKAREKTRGYPRALEALYAILSVDRYTTLEELLEISLPDEVVQKLVGEAFNRLDPSAQKVMQALAVYNRPVSPAAIDYLLQPHLPSIDSVPMLNRLVNMHFVRRNESKYHLHPVDQEFALNLIQKGSQTDWLTTGNQSQVSLERYFLEKLFELKPELTDKAKQGDQQAIIDGFAELIKILEPSDRELFQKMRKGILTLDSDILEKAKNPDIAQDKEFLAQFQDSLKQIKVSAKWSQYSLLFRAADYFAQARKPRAEWKKLDDLSAQLAEFELRCAAGDYDTAASMLMEIDFDYLLLWGHYLLMIELHEKLQRKIEDRKLARTSVGNLGLANLSIGEVQIAIEYFEQVLELARQEKDRFQEGAILGNLGNAYAALGDAGTAIEFYQQALIIAREISDRSAEGGILGNLGSNYASMGNPLKAIESIEQALVIAREIGDRGGEGDYLSKLGNRYWELGDTQSVIKNHEQALVIHQEIGDRFGEETDLINLAEAFLMSSQFSKAIDSAKQSLSIVFEMGTPATYEYGILSEAYLFNEQLDDALSNIKEAQKFDEPRNNHNISTLLGIIALRQGERETAREAFVKSIAQADEILAKTPEYYSALDAKGLALCGRALSGKWEVEREKNEVLAEAVETFRKARRIAPHAGVVKSVLRLFDELAKCDKDGVLKDVRKAAEGIGV